MGTPRKTAAKRAAASKSADLRAAASKSADLLKAAETPNVDDLMLVAALNRDVFNSLMTLIDGSNFKGADVAHVVAMRSELVRVAGLG